jgi:predicted GNAT family acetyltransferase
MLDIYNTVELIDNKASGQFEMRVDGHLGRIEYRQEGNKILLMHTEVDKELEGKGVGTAIIEKTLAYIEKNKLELVPYCPFVIIYLKRHPEWKRLLATGVKV